MGLSSSICFYICECFFFSEWFTSEMEICGKSKSTTFPRGGCHHAAGVSIAMDLACCGVAETYGDDESAGEGSWGLGSLLAVFRSAPMLRPTLVYKRPKELRREAKLAQRRGIKGSGVKAGENTHMKGTLQWAHTEMSLAQSQAIMLIKLQKPRVHEQSPEPKIANTTEKFDSIFKRRLRKSGDWEGGDSFFKAIFGPGSDKVELTNIRNQISLLETFETGRLLIYCEQPRCATIRLQPITNPKNVVSHFYLVFEFEAQPCDPALVTWMTQKNSFVRVDMRNFQVQGRDRETLEFRTSAHTATLLRANEDQNRVNRTCYLSDPSQVILTNSGKAEPIKHRVSESGISEVKQNASALDEYGSIRLTVKTDLTKSGSDDISQGVHGVQQRSRREVGERLESTIFGRASKPSDLANLGRVRQDIRRVLTSK